MKIGLIRRFFLSLCRPDALSTFANYIIKIILNPVIVVCVPIFLDEYTQGYWYTFGSIGALTVFADLGFTSIMTQYAAHEYTYLKMDSKTRLFVGNREYVDRLASLFQFIIKWILNVLLVALCIIFLVGLFLFSKDGGYGKWLFAWITYVIATVLNFSSQVELAFFEGCYQFAITQKIRMIASLFHCILTIVLLYIGFGLFALSLPLFAKAVIVYTLMQKHYGNGILQLLRHKIEKEIEWKKEFVPLLMRYAISWISGYITVQIINPLVFSLYGSVYAGKVGYSLSIIQAIYTVANVWSLISIPKYNMAVEKKEWNEMDYMVRQNIVFSIIVFAAGTLVLCIAKLIPMLDSVIWSRVMPVSCMIVLIISYLISMIIYALAAYLRAHKEEPFLLVSVMTGVISCVGTIISLTLFDVNFVFLGMLMANIVVLPMAIITFYRYRERKHV